MTMMVTIIDMPNKKGTQIVREMVSLGMISKYRLAREMGVSDTAVDDWILGKYFCEDRHLLKLLDVRDKYQRIRGMGLYSN
jgi:predicted transcriptional regulator